MVGVNYSCCIANYWLFDFVYYHNSDMFFLFRRLNHILVFQALAVLNIAHTIGLRFGHFCTFRL